MRSILIILIATILLFSCKNEKVVEIEKEYNWHKHSGFQHENVIQMNSFSTDEKLYIYGISSFTTIIGDSINQNIDFSYPNWIYQSIKYKLPISEIFHITYNDEGRIYFFQNNDQFTGGESQVRLNKIDTTFSGFHNFVERPIGECISINNNNQALIPYTTTDYNSAMKLCLIDIGIDKDVYGKLYEKNTRIFDLDINKYNGIRNWSFDEYFYVSTINKTYRIDSKGELREVLDDYLYDIFESDGDLYGLGQNEIFISSDKGLTWIRGYNISSEFAKLSYTKVDNKIIGFRQSQIFEITVNSTSISGKELDNDGLMGNTITSISEFKGRVYVTSLSGVYYKSIADFFKGK